MADRSAIEWCDSTFSAWTGCTKISPACDHCYAEALSKRAPKSIAQWGAGQPRRRTSPTNWKLPLRWNEEPFLACNCGWRGEKRIAQRSNGCPGCGGHYFNHTARRRVFCASLADVFDNEVPAAWRADLFDLIRRTPNLDWLLLTKRIGNAVAMIDEAGGWAGMFDGSALRNPLPNVWIGATVCNQAEADRDIPKLLQVPARVRFLSIEPMLGPIDLRLPVRTFERSNGSLGCSHCCNGDRCDDPSHHDRRTCPYCRGTGNARGLHWVIAGGESGAHARPSHPDWFRSLRDQCAAAGVPFLFKQWGEWLPVDADGDLPTIALDGSDRVLPGRLSVDTSFGLSDVMARVGKKAAGRMLDGRTHAEFPAHG